MRKLVIYLMVFMLSVCLFGTGVMQIAAKEDANFFDDAIFTSQDVLKNTFYTDKTESVSLVQESGVPVISITKDGSPFESNRLITKKKVESSNFVYTVEAAATKRAGAQYTEIPIIVGVKEGYGSYTQVYVNKSVDGTVTINAAALENGRFKKLWSQGCDVLNAESDETFFTIKLEVYGVDMDIYLDDEYITTITTSEEDYTGYVGVRCTGDMRIRKMTLVETADETMSDPTADTTKDPNATPSFPTDDANQSMQSPNQPSVSQPTVASTDDAGSSGTAIGAFVVGGIAVVCAVAIFVYTFIRGRKK
jgi:hypothetical protein